MPNQEGLPDASVLENFIKDNVTDKGQQQEVKTGKAETTTDNQNIDLGQFNNPKDLLKSYKEIQGYTTRIAQENKSLKDSMTKLQEQFELMKYSGQPVNRQQNQPVEDFDTQFINNPRRAVESVAEVRAQQIVRQTAIENVLAEEQVKNPDEFQERYSYAKYLADSQYPQLVGTPAGVRKLFQLADTLRADSVKKSASKAISALFGDDFDLDKLKALAKKDKPENAQNINLAYMPDTTMTSRSATDTRTGQGVNLDSAIQDAVNRGDEMAVLDNIFRRIGVKK